MIAWVMDGGSISLKGGRYGIGWEGGGKVGSDARGLVVGCG